MERTPDSDRDLESFDTAPSPEADVDVGGPDTGPGADEGGTAADVGPEDAVPDLGQVGEDLGNTGPGGDTDRVVEEKDRVRDDTAW